jgi:hypothetical protein
MRWADFGPQTMLDARKWTWVWSRPLEGGKAEEESALV